MGALRQLGLLLWRNVLRKKRQPTLFALELIWPTAIFAVIALVRMVAPPERQPTCHYQPRYMPSAGGIEFIQSFVCNVNNDCKGENQVYEEATARMSKMMSALGPLMNDPNMTQGLLMDLPKTTRMLSSLSKTLNQPKVKELIQVDMRVGNLFRDEAYLENYLTNDTQVLSPDVANGLMDAKVNLNEIYELSGFIDLQNIVCDSEKLAKYLIFSNKVDIKSISASLCAIDETLIPNITDVLRDQIDVSKILRISSKLMKLADEYTAADGLDDLADLVEIVSDHNAVKNVSQAALQLAQTSEWLGSVADFVNQLNGSVGNQVLSFSKLLDNMDPLVRNLSGRSGLWEQVRDGYNYIKMVTDWSSGGSLTLPDTTGIIWELAEKDPVLFDRMTAIFNFSEDSNKVLMKSRLNTTRISHILAAMGNNKTLRSVCEDGSLSSIFVTSSPEDALILQKASKQLCHRLQESEKTGDESSIQKNLTDTMVGLTVMSSTAGDRLNWTELASSGSRMISQVKTLSPQLSPVLDSIQNGNLQEVWEAGAQLASTIMGLNTTDPVTPTFSQVLATSSLLEGALRGQVMWPYIRTILIAANITMDIVEHIVQDLPGLDEKLAKQLANNSAFQHLVQALDQIGANNAESVINLLTDPDVLLMVMDDPAALEANLCGGGGLEGVLNIDMVSPRTLDDLKSSLCDENLISFLNKFIEESGAKNLENKVREVVGVLDGTTDIMTSEWDSRANVSQLVFGAWQMADSVSPEGELASVDWSTVMSDAGLFSLNFGNRDWKSLMSKLEQSFAMPLLRSSVMNWGKILENSTLWKDIQPVILSVYSSMTSSNIQMATLDAYMSDKEDFGRVLQYMLQYGADLAQSFANMLNNQQKRKLLFVPSDPIGLFCLPVPVGSVMNLPRDVPIDDIQKAICKIGPTDILQPASVWMENINKLFDGSNYDDKFTWESLFDTSVEYMKHMASANSDDWAPIQMAKAMESFNPEAFSRAQNAISDAINSIDEEENQRMEEFYLNVLNGLERRWAKARDPWWSSMKAKLNAISTMAKDMNNMMASLEENNKLDLSSLMSDDTKLSKMVKAVFNASPDLSDAVMTAMARPEKIMKMLSTVDLSEKSLCQGDFSLADMMDFKNPGQISKVEKMLCEMNFTEVQLELMEDPKAKKYQEMMDTLMSTTMLRKYVKVDWNDLLRTLTTNSKYMSKLMSEEAMLPGMSMMNLDGMQAQFMQLTDNYTKNTFQIVRMLSTVHDTLYNITGDNVPVEYNRAINIVQATLNLLNNEPALNVTGRSLNLVDFVHIPVLERLIDLLQDSPQISNVVMMAVSNSIMDPHRVNQMIRWLQDPGVVCNNRSALLTLFPEIATSGVNLEKVHTAFCELAKSLTPEEARNLTTSFMFAVENITKLSQKIEDALNGPSQRPDVESLIRDMDGYINLLTVMSDNPPTLDNIWGELTNPAVWSNIIGQANQTLHTINVEEVLSQALMTMSPLLLPSLPVPTETFSDFTKIMDIVYRGLEEFTAKNLTLDDLTKNRPEVAKLVGIMPKFPTAMEVILSTVFIDPAKLQSSPLLAGDWRAFCEKAAEEQFEIRPQQKQDFETFHMTVCSVDINTLAEELAGVIDTAAIDEVVTKDTNDSFDPLAMVEIGVKLQDLVMSLTSQTVPTMDLSWLDASLWSGMHTRLTATMEDKTLYESLVEAATKLSPVLESLFKQMNTTMALKPLIGLATDFTTVVDQEIKKLVALNITLSEVVFSRPYTAFLMNGLNEISSITEVLVNTALQNPDLLKRFLSGDVASLCELPLENQVIIPSPYENNYILAMSSFCFQTNYTAVSRELHPLVDFPRIQKVLQAGSQREGNVTELMAATDSLVKTLTAFTKFETNASFVFADPSLWGNVSLTFLQGLDRNELVTNLPSSLRNLYPSIWDAIDKVLSDMELGQLVNSITHVSHVVKTQLTPLSLNVSITEYLSDKPVTSQLVRLLPHLPLMMEVAITTSVNSPDKMQEIYNGNFDEICRKAGSIFSVSPDEAVRFFKTLSTLCILDYDAVQTEMSDLINVPEISKAMSPDVILPRASLSQLMDNVTGLWKTVEGIIAHPPITEPDLMRLFDATIWTAMWERVATMEQDITSLSSGLGSSLAGLEGILADMITSAGLDSMLIQIDQAIGALNRDMENIIGRNLTLEDLGKGRPETRQLLSTLPDMPLFLETIITTAIVSPSSVSQLVAGDWKTICNLPTSSFSFPPGGQSPFINVRQKLCTVDEQVLAKELDDVIFVQEIMNIIENPPAEGMRVNVTSLIARSIHLAELWNTWSMSALPMVDTSFIDMYVWNNTLSRLLSLLTQQDPLSMLPEDVMSLIPGLEGLLSNVTSSLKLNALINKAEAMAALFIDMVEPLTAVNMTIDMVKALPPETQRLIRMIPYAPTVFEVLFNTAISKPEEARRIIEGELQALCSPSMDSLLVIPENVTAEFNKVTAEFCRFDPEKLQEELGQRFNYSVFEQVLSTPMDGRANLTSFTRTADKLMKVIEKVVNSPLGSTDATSLGLKLLGPTIHAESWSSLVQLLATRLSSPENTEMLTANYLSIINTILTNITIEGELETWMIKTTALLQYINPILQQVIEGNLTHNEFLADKEDLGKLIKIIPHMLVVDEVLTLSLLYKPDRAYRVLQGDLQALCSGDPERLFEVPPRLNSTFRDITHTLCMLNYTALEREIAEMDMSLKTIQQILTSNITRGSVNTTLLVSETTKSSNLLSAFIQTVNTGLILPIDNFLNDYIYMLDRISRHVMNKTADATLENLMAQLLPMLDQLFQSLPALPSEFASILSKQEQLVDYLLEQYDNFLSRPLALDSILATSPESARVFKLLDKLPTLVEISLQSILNQAPGTQSVMSGNLVGFCTSPLSDFVLTESQQEVFEQSRMVLCTANYTRIGQELDHFIDMERLSKIFQEDGSQQMVNMTSLNMKMLQLSTSLTNIDASTVFPMEFSWINETVWSKVFENIITSLNQGNMDPTKTFSDSFNQLIVVSELFIDTLGDNGMVVKLITQVVEMFNKELQTLPNGTISLNELFKDEPELERLSLLFPHFPAIIATLLATSNERPDLIMSLTANGTVNLGALCMNNETDLFSVPPRLEEEMMYVWKYLCALNTTKLTEEINDRFLINDFLSNQGGSADQPSGNLTLLMVEMNKLVTQLTERAPNFQIDLTWLDEGVWTGILQLINSQFTMTDIPKSVSMYTEQLAVLIEAAFAGTNASNDMLASIRSASDLTMIMDRVMTIIRGPLSVDTGMYSETAKAFTLLNGLPDVLLQLLNDITSNTDKLNQVINIASTMPELLCQPGNNLVPALVPDLCALNWTKIQRELGIEMSDSSNFTFNVALSKYLENIVSVQSSMFEMISGAGVSSWPWLMEGAWRNMSDSLSHLYSTMTSMSEPSTPSLSDYKQVVASLQSMEPLLRSSGLLGQVHASNTAAEVLLNRLHNIVAMNKTSIHLIELFPDSPEIQKLFRTIEKHPGIVPILTRNINRPEFQALFTVGDFSSTWRHLTSSEENFKKYILIPNDVQIDLSALRQDLRKIHPERLIMEVYMEFSIPLIELQLNNTEPVDWSQTYDRMVNLSMLINLLMEKNISIELLGPWKDESFWTNALNQFNSDAYSYANYASLFDMLRMSNDSTVEGMYQILSVLMDSVELDLVSWAQQNQMSLGTLLKETPQLHQVVTAFLNNLPEVTGWLLYAPINNAGQLSQLLSSPNMLHHLCSSSVREISRIYRIPDSVNMTDFYTVICQVNASALDREVLDGFGLPKMINRINQVINDSLSDSVNITEVMNRFGQNTDALVKILTNPPTFLPVEVDVDQLQSVFDEFTVKIMNTEVNTTDLVANFWALVEAVYGPNASGLFGSYLVVARDFLHYTNLFLRSIEKDESQIILNDLIRDQDYIWAMLKEDLPLQSAIEFTTFRAKFEKLGALMNLEPEDMNQIFCDPELFMEYFNVSASSDLSSIFPLICGPISEAITADLQKSLNITVLLKKITAPRNAPVLDMSMFVNGLRTLLDTYFRMMNTSNGQAIGQDISSIANFTLVSNPDVWATLTGLGGRHLLSYGTLMHDLALHYQVTEFWQEEMKILSAVQTFMDVVNNKIHRMQGSGVQLSSLLTNANYTKNYLMKTFNMLPDIIDVLMASNIDSAVVTRLAAGVDNTNPFCTDAVTYPDPGQVKANITAAKDVLCSADAQIMINELSKEFNVTVIRNAFIDQADPAPLVWERYVKSLTETERLVNWFVTNVTLPTLPEFIGYKGNWTVWVDNMNKAFITPAMNDSETLNWVGAWANQQMSQLRSDPELEHYVTTVASYVNYMAEVLNGRVTPLRVNVTLRDILKNEPLVSTYLSDTFGLTPNLITELMTTGFRLDRFINWSNSTDILSLLCDGGISDVDISKIVCQANYPSMDVELRSLFKWDAFIDKLAGNKIEDDFLKPVNWTEYLHNLQLLQAHIGTMFVSPINVTHFFNYRGNLSSWIDRISAALTPLSDQSSIEQFLIYTSLGIQTAYGNIKAYQLFSDAQPLIDTIISTLTERMRAIRDGTVTIDDLLGGAPNIRSQLISLSKLTDREVDGLLMASLKLETVGNLTDPELIRAALCGRPLSEVMTLPAGGEYPNLQALQTSLCNLDLNRLSQELSQALSIDRILNEISRMQNPEMPDITSTAPYNLTSVTDPSQLLSILVSLIENPPALAPNLQLLLNFTSLTPLLDKILQVQMETQKALLKKVTNVTRECDWQCRLLGFVQTMEGLFGQIPELQAAAFTINEIIAWVNTQLTQMKDAGHNVKLVMESSANFTQLYKQLVRTLPDVQTNLLHQLRDRPELTALARLAGMQQLVCNDTAFELVSNKAGIYLGNNSLLVTEATCGQPASQWFDSLTAALHKAGFDTTVIVEVTDVFKKIQMTMVSDNMTSPEMTTGRNVLDMSTLDTNVKTLIDLIASLEHSNNNKTKEMVRDSGLSNLDNLLRSIDLEAVNHTMAFLEYQMGVLQSEMYVNGWGGYYGSNLGQLGVQALILTKYINTLLEKAQATDSQIPLTKILPDSEKVKDILKELSSFEMFSTYLEGSIPPEMLGLMLTDKVACCDKWINMSKCEDTDNEFMDAMCKQESTQPALLEKLINLIDINSTITELQNVDNSAAQNPWSELSKHVYQMLANVKTLTTVPGVSASDEMVNGWLLPIMDWATNYSQVNMDSVCSTLDKISIESQVPEILHKPASVWISGLTDIVEGLPELEPVFCGMKTLNLTALSLQAAESKIMKGIMKITQGKEVEKCSTVYGRMMTLYSVTEETMAKLQLHLDRTLTCLAQTAGQSIPALIELQGLAGIWSDIQKLIIEFPGLPEFLQNISPEIQSFLDLFLSVLIEQEPVWTDVADLFTNATGIVEYFEDVANVTPKAVDAFMTATLDLTKLPTSKSSTRELGMILCDPSKLSKLLALPDTAEVNVTTLSREFCSALLSNNTAKQIEQGLDLGKVLLKLSSTPPKYSVNTTWLTGTLMSFDDIMANVENLTGVISALGDIPSLDTLREALPDLQLFLADNGPEELYKDIIDFVGLFGDLSENPTAERVLGDVKSIGKKALDAGVFARLINYLDVNIKDVLRQDDRVIKQLQELGVDPEVARVLLDSSFSFVELLNIEGHDIPGLICDPARLGKLITLPEGSNITVAHLSRGLCGLDESKAAPVSDTIIGNLEVGGLIKDFVKLSPSNFLKESNLTKEEIKAMVERFQPAQENLKSIANSMSNMSALLSLAVNVSNPGSSTSANSVSTLSNLLCGQTSAFSIQDEFNINSGAKALPDDAQWTDDALADMEELKTEFCIDMYKQIVSSGVTGRVAWSFVKPLIIGTILYSPDTPAAKVIMDEAVWVDDAIKNITDMTKAWMDGMGSLSDFGSGSENQEILKSSLSNPFISSAMYEMAGIEGADLLDQLSSLEALSSGDLESLTVLAELMHNMTQCINIKVVGVKDEGDLVSWSQSLTKHNKLLAGVVFMNLDEAPAYSSQTRKRRDTGSNNETFTKDWLPKHLKYKIRMDTDNVPDTEYYKERADDLMRTELTYQDDRIFKAGPEDNFAEDLRYLRGFLPMEDMIERAFIRLQAGDNVVYPKIEVQQMPYPCYEQDDFSHYISRYYFPIAMTLAWLFAMGTAITLLMKDKESGMNQLMKVMGLRGSLSWLSWFVPTVIMALAVAGIITFFLKVGQLMRYSNTLIIYLCLVNFSFSACMLSYFISSLFQRATMASLTGLLIYLMSYLPYIIVVGVYVDMVFGYMVIVCISSTCAFSYAGQMMSDLEQRSIGIHWHNTDFGYHGFTFAWTQYMMLIDGAVYGLLAWYISHINPGKFGQAQPWYFPLSPSYWGCKKPKNYGQGQNEMSRRSKPMKYIDHTQATNAAYQEDAASEDTYQSLPHSLIPQGRMTTEASTSLMYITPSRLIEEKQRQASLSKSSKLNLENVILGPGEPDPVDLPVGVSLHHLTKKYRSGQRPAVNNLSVNFYQGQITAFLGHNGAGKSTTIHMLTGIFPPTSGTAYVSGYDILAQNSELKTTLGFCPQHDVLFEHMTVLEHMEFFCKAKGQLTKEEANDEVKIMINKIGLQKEISTTVSQLSGGQRRRLSVALAFIGGSKVVILDEPTSGVDPSARRLIWDLIVDHREGRTIVLSTHHLDEAEIIGDRIVVLHQGELVCSGSPLFLKSEYGSGYNLTIAKLQPRLKAQNEQAAGDSIIEECDAHKVLEFIQGYIPGARLVEEIGSEMTFMLPTSDGQVQAFRDMFVNLELAKEELLIHKYGVSDTTLEEIFLKLTTMAESGLPLEADKMREWTLVRGEAGSCSDSGRGSVSDRGSQLRKSTPKHHATSKGDIPICNFAEVAIDVGTPGPMKGHTKITGARLKTRQLRALLTKRFNHNRRDLRTYLSQLILPCLFILFAMGCTLIKPKTQDRPALLLTPELYPQQTMFFRDDAPYANDTFNKLAIDTLREAPGLGTTCMTDSEYQSICRATEPEYIHPDDPSDLPTCECRDGRQVCSRNMREFDYTVPYLKTPTKARLYNLTGEALPTSEYLLTTHKLTSNRYGGWTFDMEEGSPKATVWFNNKGHHALPAFYNTLNNMLLRANIEAADDNRSASEYGVSLYNHPLNASREQLSEFTLLQGIADTGIALTILCAYCFVPAGYIIYLIHERIHQEKQLQMICGVGILQYWFSAFIWDMLSYLLTVALTACIALAFNIPIYTARLNLPAFLTLLILFGYATIPLTYLMVGLFSDISIGYMAVFILNLFIGINATSCTFLLSLFTANETIAQAHEILQKVLLILPQYALGDGLVKLSYNQFLTSVFERFGMDNYKNPFSLEMCGWHMVAMTIEGTVFLLLTLIFDARGCVSSSSMRKRQKADYKEDSDVSLERQRVVTGEARTDLLRLHNLTKVYRRGLKKVLAVENLCLGVPKGECFGLLGVNGAGKTTTFKMITGNLLPTGGAAILNGKTISEDMSNMEQNVGYCPQQDALDPMLTGTEMIYCIARLKGVPEEDIQEVCDSALQRFGLTTGANKLVKAYSGGNKRKLSSALALLGEPELILLDEPTTGMDPATRRLVWNNITGVIKDQRSVILTSHSMAECDALCTRLAIMVNGRFTCLGSGQHLKNKFGGSYSVKLRVAGHSINQAAVVEFMHSTFPDSYLKSRHHHVLEFEIPAHVSSLAELFGVLEMEKLNLHVEDYSISQTTLDQLFVNFAEGQTDGQLPEPEDDPTPDEGASSVYAYTNRAYDTLGENMNAKPAGKMYQANIKANTGSLRLRSNLTAMTKVPSVHEDEKTEHAPVRPSLTEGLVLDAPLRSGAPLRHVPPLVRAEALNEAHQEAEAPERASQEGGQLRPGMYDNVAGVPEMEYIPTESLSIRL